MSRSSELFKTRLRKARRIRELSQAKLAAKAGFPASAISHFEVGSRKPSFENLRRLAMALSVSADFLLGLVDEFAWTADADPLYRDLKNLPDTDRQMVRAFLQGLTQRKRHNGNRACGVRATVVLNEVGRLPDVQELAAGANKKVLEAIREGLFGPSEHEEIE